MSTLRTGIVFLLVAGAVAHAEVKQPGADGFIVAHEVALAAPPAAVYRKLADVAHWWSSAHTWSGSALNLSLKAEAGACFCEKWKDGSVEHGRVISAQNDRLLRLSSALGPLQEMAVAGVLTFALEPRGSGTAVALTYRVSGDRAHALDKIAPAVDKVLAEQVGRLKRFVETGKPD